MSVTVKPAEAGDSVRRSILVVGLVLISSGCSTDPGRQISMIVDGEEFELPVAPGSPPLGPSAMNQR